MIDLERVSSLSFTLHGIPVTNGIAIGKALRIAPSAMDVKHYLVDEGAEQAEEARLLNAFEVVRQELKSLRASLPDAAPEEMGAFLDVIDNVFSHASSSNIISCLHEWLQSQVFHKNVLLVAAFCLL